MTGSDHGLHFATTRQAGLQRLQEFTAAAGANYARYRNTDFGPNQPAAVSRLSPYIRHRLINEVEVLNAVLSRHGPEQAEKFVQEVFWRTYFKGYLEHKPWLWSRYCQELTELRLQLTAQSSLAMRYENAISGGTGIEPFDHWVQDLVRDNYLHNHARMWFASIWIFTLELPWQLGADFFMEHLLDGDPASNTLSWRWVAGLHTKGKHYLARAENILRYSEGRFTQVRGLNESAQPLTEALFDQEPAVVQPSTVQAEAVAGSDYCALVHEEDLHWPELASNATTVTVLGAVPGRSSQGSAAPVNAFVQGACTNVASTLGAGPLLRSDAAQIAQWARGCRVPRLYCAYPPVGPVRDILTSANRLLAPDQLQIQWVQRAYDSLSWPHCQKGFFALKKKIPQLLERLKAHAN